MAKVKALKWARQRSIFIGSGLIPEMWIKKYQSIFLFNLCFHAVYPLKVIFNIQKFKQENYLQLHASELEPIIKG